MKPNVEYALEQEQRAAAAEKRGDIEEALWARILARQSWRDAVREASPEERAALEVLHEKSLRAIAVAAERAADQAGRPPAPTQSGANA